MAARTEGVTGKQLPVKNGRIERRITEEGIGIDEWMSPEKVLKSGNEKPCIVDGFILIGGVGFFIYLNFGMLMKEILIIKSDMADNTEPIRNEAKLEGITEMPVKVHLLDVRIGRSMGRQGRVGGFVRIKMVIKVHGFGVSLKLFDDTVGVFRVVFRNPGFNTGGIKDSHRSFFGIDLLANGFRDIDKAIKNNLKIKDKILFETGDLRGIGNFIKTTELSEMSGIMEKDKEQGISGNGKDTLKDKSPEHGV